MSESESSSRRVSKDDEPSACQEGSGAWRFMAKFLVNHPFIMLLICSSVVFGLSGIVSAGGFFELTDTGDRDYLIYSDELVQRQDAFVVAKKSLADQDSFNPVRSQIRDRWTTSLMYKAENADTMLTVEGLAAIRRVEDRIIQDPRYKEFCYAGDQSPDCSPKAVSSLTAFFGRDWNQEQIDERVGELSTQLNTIVSQFFGKEFSEENPKSKYVRSFFIFGAPLGDDGTGRPFQSEDDRGTDQDNIFKEWYSDILDFLIDESSTDAVQVSFIGETVFNLVFERVIFSDMLFAVGSIMFVFSYVTFHTSSFVLSSTGIMGILMAFPLSYFWYRVIFGIKFFQSLHMLTVFVILGIGADDIFVFVDAWNQAAVELPGALTNMVDRMEWTYARAVKAMFVTSVTTMAAFLATAASPIMPISSFGIFAAILIVMNYTLVITQFPAFVVIWEKYSRNRCCCRGRVGASALRRSKRRQQLVEASAAVHAEHAQAQADKSVEEASSDSGSSDSGSKGRAGTDASSEEEEAGQQDAGVAGLGFNRTERFFYDKFAPKVLAHKRKIVAFFFVLFVGAVSTAFQISPLSKQENFFKDSHFLTVASEVSETSFAGGAENGQTVPVYFMWGVQGVDRSGSSFYDASDLGEVVFDDEFDLSAPATQQYVADVCDRVQSFELTFKGLVRCFMWSYRDWRQAQGQLFPAVFSPDAATQRAEFVRDLDAFLKSDAGTTFATNTDVGINSAGELKFVRVKALTALLKYRPRATTLPQFEKWEALQDEVNADAPSTAINKAYHFNRVGWPWMASESAFVTSAVQGITISITIAFFALVLSTMNLFIGLFATICIAGIVACVTAMMVLMGWELGVAESVSVVILVGFSVDYVVHLANSYIESHAVNREDKVREALREMGISVLAGATTTFGSASFLWFCTTVFFLKFAALMMLTVFFSLSWATILFSALAAWVGPEGETGSLRAYARRCCGGGDKADLVEVTNREAEEEAEEV